MLSFASLSLFSVFHSATCSLPFCIIQYLQLSSCFLPFAHSPSPSLSHFLLYLPVFHSLLFFHLLPLPSTGLHHRSIVESHNYRIGELHHVHSFFSPLHAHTSTYHYPWESRHSYMVCPKYCSIYISHHAHKTRSLRGKIGIDLETDTYIDKYNYIITKCRCDFRQLWVQIREISHLVNENQAVLWHTYILEVLFVALEIVYFSFYGKLKLCNIRTKILRFSIKLIIGKPIRMASFFYTIIITVPLGKRKC